MRRTVLDAQRRGEICGILAMGGTRAVAARYIGCSPSTVYRAARKDPDFARQLRAAEGRAEILQLKNITDAAAGSNQYWRAAAWMLERRFPERYANRAADTATIEQLAQIVNRFTDLMIAEIEDAALRQRILDRLGELTQQLEPRRKGKRTA
jgi:hypothetical protein